MAGTVTDTRQLSRFAILGLLPENSVKKSDGSKVLRSLIITDKQGFIDTQFNACVSHGMPVDLAVFVANEYYAIWNMGIAPAGNHELTEQEYQTYMLAIKSTYLYPYGVEKPSSNLVEKLGTALVTTAASMIPSVGAAVAPYLGKLVSGKQIQPVSYGDNLSPLAAEYLLPTVLKNSSIKSGISSQLKTSSTMLDLLKKWLVVIVALVVAAAGILYYTSAKNTTDKKKRKVFLYLGIAAASVGAFFGYKKITGK